MADFLIHEKEDTVGVAVRDIQAGERVTGRVMSDQSAVEVQARMDIPLGHKIALRDFAEGDTVIKYGCDIGRVVAPIQTGEHVHVHNLKTKRW